VLLESCVRRQLPWVALGMALGVVAMAVMAVPVPVSVPSVSGGVSGGGVLGPNTATRTLDFQGTRDTLQRTSLASSSGPRW